MATSVFVDSAAWQGLIDRKDAVHARTAGEVKRLLQAGARLITSDYVIDEACTLIQGRVGAHAALRLLQLLDETRGVAMEWVGPDRFVAARAMFRKHHDQGFSFTDCTSFVLMEELGLREALTTDEHFRVRGFHPLLA